MNPLLGGPLLVGDLSSRSLNPLNFGTELRRITPIAVAYLQHRNMRSAMFANTIRRHIRKCAHRQQSRTYHCCFRTLLQQSIDGSINQLINQSINRGKFA